MLMIRNIAKTLTTTRRAAMKVDNNISSYYTNNPLLLVICISDYDELPELKGAIKDMDILTNLFEGKFGYQNNQNKFKSK